MSARLCGGSKAFAGLFLLPPLLDPSTTAPNTAATAVIPNSRTVGTPRACFLGGLDTISFAPVRKNPCVKSTRLSFGRLARARRDETVEIKLLNYE